MLHDGLHIRVEVKAAFILKYLKALFGLSSFAESLLLFGGLSLSFFLEMTFEIMTW